MAEDATEGAAPPPSSPAPATPGPEPATAPAPDGPRHVWDDYAGATAAVLALLGAMLPWYDGHDWVAPTEQGLATAALAALAFVLVLLLPGPRNEKTRRQVSLVLGAAVFLLAAWVATSYYLFHLRRDPQLGLVGHLGFVGVGLWLTLLGGLVLAWSGLATRRPGPEPRARREPVELGMRRLARWGIPLLVFAGAFTFYAHDVEHPAIIDFDEAHYVKVARNMTDGHLIDPGWAEPRPFNFEHPPVGKYLIALGYWAAGEPHDEMDAVGYQELCGRVNPACERDAFSWRFGSVLVGSLGVLGMYWLGLRLFQSLAVGVIAALFLLMDPLYYLHSRLALLDIFAAAFALLALGVVLGPTRRHAWAGSLVFGLALASKHTALFLAPAFIGLLWLRSTHTSRWMRLREALILTFVVPFAVYTFTYAPYFWVWTQQDGPLFAVNTFVYVHQEGFRWLYRADVDPHSYSSDAWTWIVMRRPVLYFVGYNPAGNVGHIYAIGSPFVWWLGSVAALYTWFVAVHRFATMRVRWGLRAFWEWLARPFAYTPERSTLVASLLFAAAYGPFLALKRDPFLFYFVFAAPYLSLILAAYVAPLWSRGVPHRLVAWVVLVAAAAVFAFYHPVVAGTYIPEADFQYIMHRVPRMTQ